MSETQSYYYRFKSFLLDWSDTPLRLILAATFIAHGYGKLYGGVDGFAGMLGQMGVPAPVAMAWLVTAVELFGGIFLLFGFMTRIAALAIGVNMLTAILLVHRTQGFMMKSGSGGSPAGYEWQLALLAMCVTLMMRGAGSLSVDHMLRAKRKNARQQERYASAERRTGSAATSISSRVTQPSAEKPRIPKP